MANKYAEYVPKHDSTLGLIFRLNDLWNRVDNAFLAGNLEKANYTLDRIYCNLLYREEIVIDTDGKTKIKVTNKEKIVKKFFDLKILKVKEKEINSKDINGKKTHRAKLYQILELKDVWLRKFMQSLGLYLKESKRDPSNALFGGG